MNRDNNFQIIYIALWKILHLLENIWWEKMIIH